MTPDQGTDPEVLHNKPYDRLAPLHGRYLSASHGLLQINHPDQLLARIGDEVGEQVDHHGPTVVAIYDDGMVELSTGDQVPAADLVLLRRAQ